MGVVGAFILAQGLLWSLAYADATNLNPTGQGCVDPNGYLQCYSDNADKLTSCMDNAQKTCTGDTLTECQLACGDTQMAANIGCWLTSCWNQVYSCAYQETVLQYLTGADLEQGPTPVPYYPAPDNAPGGCGKLYYLQSTAQYYQMSHTNKVFGVQCAIWATSGEISP